MSKTYIASVVVAVLIVCGVAALWYIPARAPTGDDLPKPIPVDQNPATTTPVTNRTDLPVIDPSQKGQPTYVHATPNDIQVTLPFPGAVTGKDFSVRGKARDPWFFEASFPVLLFDKNGNQIGQGLAQVEPAGTNWMTTDFVNFKADISTPKTFIGPATLVLMKDNPSGDPAYDASVSFPITVEY